MMKAMAAAIGTVAFTIAVVGCREEGPAERAGQEIDEAVEESREAAEGTLERLGRELDEAAEETEEAADAVEETVEQAEE